MSTEPVVHGSFVYDPQNKDNLFDFREVRGCGSLGEAIIIQAWDDVYYDMEFELPAAFILEISFEGPEEVDNLLLELGRGFYALLDDINRRRGTSLEFKPIIISPEKGEPFQFMAKITLRH